MKCCAETVSALVHGVNLALLPDITDTISYRIISRAHADSIREDYMAVMADLTKSLELVEQSGYAKGNKKI